MITNLNIKNKMLKYQSKKTKKYSESGITLIALVVTIIVLLILIGVVINLIFSDHGIIAKARESSDRTESAALEEQEKLSEADDYIGEMISNSQGGNTDIPEGTDKLPSDGSYSEIKEVNTPDIENGQLIPIKWDSEKGEWIETTGDDEEWYEYGTTNDTKRWANAKTEDGSMWVWIPRYAYCITSGYHSSSAGTIEIEFMKGTRNESSRGRTVFQNESGANNWNIHPAFEYGGTVSGIWVAKFEASRSDATAQAPGSSETIKVQPGVQSWRKIKMDTAYTNCLNYNGNLNSHLMKNDEWGAVAYLSKSKYGKETEEVWKNNSSSFITGAAGNSVSAGTDIGTDTNYTSSQGVKASTTGTVYGIYDMSGGAWELVAAYVDNVTPSLENNGNSLYSSTDTKTKNVYASSRDSAENNYNENSGKYGDALYETSGEFSSNSGAWYADNSSYPYTGSPFFIRGGSHSITTSCRSI